MTSREIKKQLLSLPRPPHLPASSLALILVSRVSIEYNYLTAHPLT